MQEDGYASGLNMSRENIIESQRGRNFTIPQPIAEEEQQQQLGPAIEDAETKESAAAAFIDSIKNFFAPCVGAVDAASLFIGECRPTKYDTCDPIEQGENVAEDVIMKLRERNGAFKQPTGKRRSETLEIPTHGMLFDDDDVSAISSHTLEEMERLRIAQSSRLSNFHLSPSNIYESTSNNILRPNPADKLAGKQAAARKNAFRNNTWNIQQSPTTEKKTVHATSERDLSISISTSDSSSSDGFRQRENDTALAKSTPPSWGNKAGKGQGFKTHRIG